MERGDICYEIVGISWDDEGKIVVTILEVVSVEKWAETVSKMGEIVAIEAGSGSWGESVGALNMSRSTG